MGSRGQGVQLRSQSPALCSRGRGCACASVCVAECRACVWRRVGERAVSRSTVLCQAPSAAPFAFNGLSKDPLSRAAESFLHFKKKKERKVGISHGSGCVRRCWGKSWTAANLHSAPWKDMDSTTSPTASSSSPSLTPSRWPSLRLSSSSSPAAGGAGAQVPGV